jgi:pimeloyl-ACP methyl ester carboxylesterase
MTAATPTIPKIPDQCAPSATSGRPAHGVNSSQLFKVDYLEAGSSGPVVMLVHSSVSGARQWRRLMDELKNQCRVRAVNLFGYGKTPSWPAEATQTLSDQARLVEPRCLLTPARFISSVIHSAGRLP